MTEFTKTKIHFALALLGSLFALHPFLERFEDASFVYLDYTLKVSYAYLLLAGLLALCVYCYGLTLVSERPHSWLERLGNYSYGLAVMVLPFYVASTWPACWPISLASRTWPGRLREPLW